MSPRAQFVSFVIVLGCNVALVFLKHCMQLIIIIIIIIIRDDIYSAVIMTTGHSLREFTRFI